jgi:DnaK suppressor protein
MINRHPPAGGVTQEGLGMRTKRKTPMNKKDLTTIEKKLLDERGRLIQELGRLDSNLIQNVKESSGDLSSYAFHMADLGSDAFEREMSFLRSSTEGELLYDTIDALRRLYREEFGTCESCGEPIGRERLMALPQARLCIACKGKEEKRRGAR